MPFKIKMKRVCNMRYGKEKMILKRMSHLEFYEKIKKKTNSTESSYIFSSDGQSQGR